MEKKKKKKKSENIRLSTMRANSVPGGHYSRGGFIFSNCRCGGGGGHYSRGGTIRASTVTLRTMESMKLGDHSIGTIFFSFYLCILYKLLVLCVCAFRLQTLWTCIDASLIQRKQSATIRLPLVVGVYLLTLQHW